MTQKIENTEIVGVDAKNPEAWIQFVTLAKAQAPDAYCMLPGMFVRGDVFFEKMKTQPERHVHEYMRFTPEGGFEVKLQGTWYEVKPWPAIPQREEPPPDSF